MVNQSTMSIRDMELQVNIKIIKIFLIDVFMLLQATASRIFFATIYG